MRRLREAGAVIIGKTNVPELTQWPFTETATFGATRNPWNSQHAPGGSSGGSAAAVAAGLVGAALGSDGAGSIRIPAAWCGLFGLKPQRGRVSMAPRSRGWHGLSVKGLLARTVADTALFHDVASGAIDVDADRVPAPDVPFSTAAATHARTAANRLLDERAHGCDREARRGRRAGRSRRPSSCCARSATSSPSATPTTAPARSRRCSSRYLRGIHDNAVALAHPERLERRTRRMSRLGGLIPAVAARTLARGARRELTRRLGRVFEDHDVLLTPATAAPPPRIGRLQGRGALWTLNTVGGWVPYNGVWNVTGQPAASVPAGFGADGLPRAVQTRRTARRRGHAAVARRARSSPSARGPQQRPPEFS